MASRLDKVPTRGFEPISRSKENKTVQKKEAQEEYTSIPLSLIEIESNIRSEYNDEDIKNLSDSMLQYGQLEAIRVFEKGAKYVIVFGHRRYLAAKKAKLKEIKCVVTDKPDTLDKLYIQAIENEHSVNLSPSDREKYIKLLKTKYKQSVSEIASKLGKSETWIYRSLNAAKFREENQDIFDKAGVSLTTEDASALNNYSKDQITKAVDLMAENPGNKTKILKNIKKDNTKKKGSRTSKISSFSPKKETDKDDNDNAENIENTDDNLENDFETETNKIDTEKNAPKTFNNIPQTTVFDNYKHNEITIKISKDDDSMKIKIKSSCQGDYYDSKIIPVINEKIIEYYKNEGYDITND